MSKRDHRITWYVDDQGTIRCGTCHLEVSHVAFASELGQRWFSDSPPVVDFSYHVQDRRRASA